MSEPTPYGAWPSALGTDALLSGELRLGAPARVGSDVVWAERRPSDGGRSALVRATATGGREDLTPPGFDVRSRVHEYGGGAWWPIGRSIALSDDSDGRLHRLDPGGEPFPITPEPDVPRGVRYADGVASPDDATIWCVRETHGAGTEPVNEIVSLPATGGEPVVVASGRDFYAAPRLSPDGRSLCWLEWDHPRMPWDGTELALAAPDGSGRRIVAGGPEESIASPSFSPACELHFCSDRSNWWNLHRLSPDGSADSLCPIEAEIGAPAWVFGMQPYAFLADGRVACLIASGGHSRVALLDPDRRELSELAAERVPANATLASDGERLLFSGAGPVRGSAIVALDPDSGAETVLARAADAEIDAELVSVAREIEFDSAGGERAHALFYAPVNPAARPPADECPPLLVLSHGGPTARVTDELDLEIQFWTSRGFAVCDVNYGGSTGYGRAYRRRLEGRWGIVDVDDCVAAVRHLADAGEIDRSRVAIRGGSAGGYTTLRALTDRDDFAAGASLYGVGDLAALARDTHKFESRYLDGLIGPYPERADLYAERSPINHVDGLSCPVILLQGLEDEVVPPAQAEAMVAALERKGIRHAYLAFEGEQHGFRRAETIRRAAESELAFYGEIFGFEPADELPPLELRGGSSS